MLTEWEYITMSVDDESTPKKTKHTPLPWKVSESINRPYDILNEDEHGCSPIVCAENPYPDPEAFSDNEIYREDYEEFDRVERAANAAFIARACNSHYDLVKALEVAICLLSSFVKVAKAGQVAEVGIGPFRDIGEIYKILTIARGE